MVEERKIGIELPIPFSHQIEFIDFVVDCLRKGIGGRGVVRAGRRGGKTVGAAEVAVEAFVAGFRVLYTAPTDEQKAKFWFEMKLALSEAVREKIYRLNEAEDYIEKVGTENRIKAKTAWNADTMRGDYADLLIFDEYQLTNEDAWEIVGMPMLLDNNGVALFIYTPPSLRSAGVSKARDPRHAAKLFKKAQQDTTSKWRAFHFTSHDNPHLSKIALEEIIRDMSKQSYRQEILAEDDEIQLSWLVYRAFNEATNKIDDFEIPKSWLVYSGHDFGGANPAALFVAQDPATGNFYEFKEYLPGAGCSTAEHAEAFKKITDGYNVLVRAGGSHQEDEIRQGYGAHGWPIAEPRIRAVNTQVDRVIGNLELNKIFIFKSLYNRLEELMNCLWEPDAEGRPTDKIKDEARYHLCACARYLYSNFTPETVVSGGRQKAISNH